MKRNLVVTMKNINDIEDRITFEREKIFREASSAAAEDISDVNSEEFEMYPHEVTRTLTVTEMQLKSKPVIEPISPNELLFKSLTEAIHASKSGDLIELLPGFHSMPDVDIKHSLQLVGKSKGVVIIARKRGLFSGYTMDVTSADVRLANIKVDASRKGSISFSAKKGGRLWFENCEIINRDSQINIHHDSSAVITRC